MVIVWYLLFLQIGAAVGGLLNKNERRGRSRKKINSCPYFFQSNTLLRLEERNWCVASQFRQLYNSAQLLDFDNG